MYKHHATVVVKKSSSREAEEERKKLSTLSFEREFTQIHTV